MSKKPCTNDDFLRYALSRAMNDLDISYRRMADLYETIKSLDNMLTQEQKDSLRGNEYSDVVAARSFSREEFYVENFLDE
jgi:hypothetical protein